MRRMRASRSARKPSRADRLASTVSRRLSCRASTRGQPPAFVVAGALIVIGPAYLRHASSLRSTVAISSRLRPSRVCSSRMRSTRARLSGELTAQTAGRVQVGTIQAPVAGSSEAPVQTRRSGLPRAPMPSNCPFSAGSRSLASSALPVPGVAFHRLSRFPAIVPSSTVRVGALRRGRLAICGEPAVLRRAAVCGEPAICGRLAVCGELAICGELAVCRELSGSDRPRPASPPASAAPSASSTRTGSAACM